MFFFSNMDFFHFVSLMLMFSLTALAFPQTIYFGEDSKLPENGESLEKLQTSALNNQTKSTKFAKINAESPENKNLVKILLDKVKPDLGNNERCLYKISRIVNAQQQPVDGVNTKMRLKVCPDRCSPFASVVNKGCKTCEVQIYVLFMKNSLPIDEFNCE